MTAVLGTALPALEGSVDRGAGVALIRPEQLQLVRTPMIAPTKIYDKFPTISPAQAADLVIRAMVERPHEINTMLGNAGAIAHTVAPKLAFRVLNMAYHVFPDSAAAKGQKDDNEKASMEQVAMAPAT